MRLFFELWAEIIRIKHDFRIEYVKVKTECEIYVYEKKLQIYESFCKKFPPEPKFDNKVKQKI